MAKDDGCSRPQAKAAVQRPTARAVQANDRLRAATGFLLYTEMPMATFRSAIETKSRALADREFWDR
jgi:hypothetical protein